MLSVPGWHYNWNKDDWPSLVTPGSRPSQRPSGWKVMVTSRLPDFPVHCPNRGLPKGGLAQDKQATMGGVNSNIHNDLRFILDSLFRNRVPELIDKAILRDGPTLIYGV